MNLLSKVESNRKILRDMESVVNCLYLSVNVFELFSKLEASPESAKVMRDTSFHTLEKIKEMLDG